MRAQRQGSDVLEIDVELPVGETEEALSTALRSVAEGSSEVVTS